MFDDFSPATAKRVAASVSATDMGGGRDLDHRGRPYYISALPERAGIDPRADSLPTLGVDRRHETDVQESTVLATMSDPPSTE